MNDKQSLERIVGLVNEWIDATKKMKRLDTCIEYPPSFLEDTVMAMVAYQGLTVGENPFDFPFVPYSGGNKEGRN